MPGLVQQLLAERLAMNMHEIGSVLCASKKRPYHECAVGGARYLYGDGRLLRCPHLDRQWVEDWRQLQRRTVKTIKSLWAQYWDRPLQRDRAVGKIVNKAFQVTRAEYGFLEHCVWSWNFHDLQYQTDGRISATKFSYCCALAKCVPEDELECFVEAGVSEQRMRDVVILLHEDETPGLELEEVLRVLPRSPDNDERQAFYRWVDRRLLQRKPHAIRHRAIYKRWIEQTETGRRYAQKAKTSSIGQG